jgi:alanine-glyoxylate transaminase/serine-glyoxylate transaminase/serine-pyruvate transaminase
VGLESYYARHVEAAQFVRRRLGRLGFQMLMPETNASPLITTVRQLPEMDVEDLRRYLLEEWQIMIGGGIEGRLRGKIFRVGHTGKAASIEYRELFIEAVEAYLKLKGYDVPAV